MASETQAAVCEDCGFAGDHMTLVCVSRQRDQLRSDLAAAQQLIDGWEMLGATITGCTNHSGQAALDDAKWQNEMHLRVSTGLLSAANDKLAAAQQLGDAERAAVEACVEWRRIDEQIDTEEKERVANLDQMADNVDALLALRAAAGKGQADGSMPAVLGERCDAAEQRKPDTASDRY